MQIQDVAVTKRLPSALRRKHGRRKLAVSIQGKPVIARERFQGKQGLPTARPSAREPPSKTEPHSVICTFLVFSLPRSRKGPGPTTPPATPPANASPSADEGSLRAVLTETSFEFSRSYSVKPILQGSPWHLASES